MPKLEVTQEAFDHIESMAKLTKQSQSSVISAALAAYGLTPARGLGFDAARVLLACQGRDILKIYGWIQDKVLSPVVIQRLGEFASAQGEDFWLPACGGSEIVCRCRSGQEYLYCWNPGTGKHAYYLLGDGRWIPDHAFNEFTGEVRSH